MPRELPDRPAQCASDAPDVLNTPEPRAESRVQNEPDHAIAESAEAFATFVTWLEPEAPPEGGRGRLLACLRPEGRLDVHACAVARLLDIDEPEASRLLTAAADPATYEPGPFAGVSLHHVAGGPAVAGAITGFVRLAGGAEFPSHAHLGDERVLIVQGSLYEPETGHVARPGELLHAAAGSSHTSIARPGPDLVYLAVLFEGLRVGDTELRASDPRL